MAIRVSFEIDRDVRDAIEKYARENGLEFTSSIQDLLIKGIAAAYSGKKYDIELLKNQAHEEYRQILENTSEVHTQVTELAKELKLMHYLLETGWQPNADFVVHKEKIWKKIMGRVKEAIIAVARPFMPKTPDMKQITGNNSQQNKIRRQP